MSHYNPILPHIISQKQVRCGFTTRNGGVSLPPYDSLNLGGKTADDPLNIRGNRSIVYYFSGVDEKNVALMEQVHGNNISIVHTGGIFPETDSLITSKSGIMLGVLVADCIPLLLFDPTHRVIGVVHCGWRSIVAEIAEKTINTMIDEMGTHPEDVLAVMGPSAGSCCYKIDKETADLLLPESIIVRHGEIYADLRAELRVRLLTAGFSDQNIEIFSDCTICNEQLYFSHRRDKKNAGRMMGYIIRQKDKG